MKNRKKTIIIVLIFFLVCLAAVIFYLKGKGVTKYTDANILVITLDTTRADRIGIYGYGQAQTPNIDNLARQGTWFANAISSVPITLPSHCSILTGTCILYHQVRNNGSYFLPENIDTLAEILKQEDYVTSAFIAAFVLDSKFGLDQGFDLYNDQLPLKQSKVKTFYSERPAELVFKDFSSWFNKNHEKKFFSWIHFYDPHTPYSPPEPYKSQLKSDPYDGEIAYMDEYLGKVIALLKEKKVLENTLVVVVGDHGEAFGEHGEYGHGFFCYEESLRVPLIFYSQKGLPKNKQVNHRVNVIDVMPTILDYLGIKIPKHCQGQSLLSTMHKSTSKGRSFYIETIMPNEVMSCAIIKGIVKDDYKYIDLPRPELYDLKKDPLEKKNLYFKYIKQAKELQKGMEQLETKYNILKPESKRKLSTKDMEKLRSLGYLSSAGGDRSSQKRADPKDKIESWNQCLKGNEYFSEGKIEEAIQSLEKSIALDEQYSAPYVLLAYIHYEKGNIEEAEQLYRKGIEVNPDDYILAIEYVKLLIYQKKFTEALKKLSELEILNLLAFEVEVFYLTGIVHMNMNSLERAVDYYKKALEREPDNHIIKMDLAHCLNRQNKYSESLRIYLEMERNTPDDTGLLLDIAVIYSQLNEHDRSKSYFKKLLKKNPPPIAYYHYAILLSKTEELDEAIKNMRIFTNLYTKDDIRRKDALMNLENWATQNNSINRFKRAFELQRSGKPEEALQIYLQLEKTSPNDFNLVFSMAMVYGMLEKYSKSFEYFERCLQINPQPVIYFNYAFYLAKAGKYSDALRNMNQFLKLYPNTDETRQRALQFIKEMESLIKK
jgi:arylsulfatase A-like enzyme/Tfp pilus assembly protein PilF